MKQPHLLTLYTHLIALLLSGCNVIDGDNYKIDYSPPIPEGANTQSILLEDYTGMRCVNCPQAAAKALELKEAFGQRLVVVSIHAGSYAKPINGHDLRTEAGSEYAATFKISGYPQGMVNRSPYKGETHFAVGKWDGAISDTSPQSPIALQVDVTYSTPARQFSVEVVMTKKSPLDQPQELLIWLVEDKVTTPQMTTEGTIPEYCQRHVFRGALNGTWGEAIDLPASPAAPPVKWNQEYSLPESYRAENCSVVALLCNREGKEIIQVGECTFIK